MTPRRITAAICLVAIVLLLAGAFSKRWLVADMRSYEMNASLRIGLTGVQVCVATEEIARCENVDWSKLQSQFRGRIEGGSWMWLGRLTFALSLIAAAVLAGLGIVAASDRRVELPVSLPRFATWTSLALFPFMAGYYVLTPNAFSSIAAGRGFLLAALGAIAGVVAAFRESSDRLD
jgi:hypothetical protein